VTIDTTTALEAADTWKRLASLVPTIELYLEPTRSGGNSVRRPAQSAPPLSIHASDLLMELDVAASFYCSALMMETPDVKRLPHGLAAQLMLIGRRHGHFTADPDQKIALDFCDEAHDLLTKVIALIMKPLPPQWMGPCQACRGGDLWLKDGRAYVTCDACSSVEDLQRLHERLHTTMRAMVVKRAEIAPALRLLGSKATANTVKAWVQRGRLVPVMREPEVFRMADALELCRDLRVAV